MLTIYKQYALRVRLTVWRCGVRAADLPREKLAFDCRWEPQLLPWDNLLSKQFSKQEPPVAPQDT